MALTLRDEILRVGDAGREVPQLLCRDRFSPEDAIQELYDRAMEHRIRRHPLLLALSKDGFSKEETKLFLSNYYVNNRVFHLHVAAQSLSTPLRMRGEFYKNLYNELGAGEVDEAHPLLFLKSFNSLGGMPEFVVPLPESLHLLNAKIYQTFLSGHFTYGTGGLGFLELAMPAQMEMLYTGLQKSGLPKDDLVFWELHITMDQDHGQAWFDEMLTVIKDVEDAERTLDGGLALLAARAQFYDGVWSAIGGSDTAVEVNFTKGEQATHQGRT